MSYSKYPLFSVASRPFAYREVEYNFEGGNFFVAAHARPDYFYEPRQTMAFLKKRRVTTIYGLDVDATLIETAQSLGMTYINANIPDFTAPPVSLFDTVYQTIIEQGQDNKVAIHCRGGMGRTGTILVALKLKELSAQEPFYNSDLRRSFIIDRTEVTENVYKALSMVRAIKGNSHVVEATCQIEALCSYEEMLHEEHLKLTRPDTSSSLST